jgi:hypothetical protein
LEVTVEGGRRAETRSRAAEAETGTPEERIFPLLAHILGEYREFTGFRDDCHQGLE